MTARLEPFLLDPVLVERPWGGRRLEHYGKVLPAGVLIGESWEVADLPDDAAPTVEVPRSRVATGPFIGATLGELMRETGEQLLGPVAPASDGRFPLLVKVLDAREHLSIQVHPPADYVATHPEARLKTESWYVMEATPDAELFLDVEAGVGLDDIAAVMATPDILELLQRVPGRVGDLHHVPAGLIHSLGAGLMVAEVQTPSDTTFRIYDWAAEYGRAPRPLHPEQSLASIRIHPDEAHHVAASTEMGSRRLITNEHYWIVEHRVDTDRIDLTPGTGPRILMVVSGSIAIDGLTAARGTTAIVPATAWETHVAATGAGTLLEVGLAIH